MLIRNRPGDAKRVVQVGRALTRTQQGLCLRVSGPHEYVVHTDVSTPGEHRGQ